MNHLSGIWVQTEIKSHDSPILSALLRELQPTTNPYRIAVDLQSLVAYLLQLSSSQFGWVEIGCTKLSPLVRELQPTADQVFKDNYVLEFLGLPDDHSEGDLQKALIQNM